jgi:hypothetical protein
MQRPFAHSFAPLLPSPPADIDRHNLLPPLLVMEILGQNELWTLAIVKDYLVRRLEAENTEIAEVCPCSHMANAARYAHPIPSHPAPMRLCRTSG